MKTLTITRPDDWHIHLRDGDVLAHTVKDVARYFGRAIIMPNLVPPVATTAQALAYRERILQAVESTQVEHSFNPLMVLYLTDNTSVQEIELARQSAQVYAAKLYPSGATTNSDAGVTQVSKIYPVLEAMQANNLPLLIHGEVTDNDTDIFDREKVFIDTVLTDIVATFPALKIVLEHITTRDAVDFVKAAPANVAATITAHHLLYNRNHMLVGGIRPHYFCLPILKRNTHQQALIDAASSANPKFFLGTDSAPHSQQNKETSCGCAGCYTAHAAIEMYAEAFDRANALDKLEGFASFFGADFYGLSRNEDSITLRQEAWNVSEQLSFGEDTLVPLGAGESLAWQVDKNA